MKFRKKSEVLALKEHEATPLRIINDAVIATRNFGGGKLIPLVIVDTSARPDFNELVRVHEYLGSGDVVGQWGERAATAGSGQLSLILSFKRPSELTVILDFDIDKQGGLVDQIVFSNGLYIQPGNDGDRFINTPEAPRILVEVGESEFREKWEDMFYDNLVKSMRKRGLRRHQAKQAAKEFIVEWRKFGRIRMK